MQDNGELAGEGHFGELYAAPLCDPHRPATQAGPAPVMHQDVRGLIEGSAHHFIAAAADMSVVVDLPGAVASRRQAKMSSNISGSREALRYIDPGPVGKRNDHAHARHGHQEAADGIVAGQLSCHAIETNKLIHENPAHAQHRFSYRYEGGMSFDELEDTRLEGALGHMA